MCTASTLTVTLIPFHIITLVITTFRVYLRWLQDKLWWDDYCAAAALVIDLAFTTGIVLNTLRSSNRTIIVSLIVIPIYLLSFLARLSLGLTITRTCAPLVGRSWPFHAMNMMFGVIFIATMIPGIMSAAPSCMDVSNLEGWIPEIHCHIFQIDAAMVCFTDYLSDLILIGVPLHILRRIKLPTKQRRMILVIFSAGAISSGPAVAYVIAAAIPANLLCISLIIHLKVPIMIIVCNLLFTVTYIHHRFFRGEDIEATVRSETNDRTGLDGGVYTNIGSLPLSSIRLTMITNHDDLMMTQGYGSTTAPTTITSTEFSSLESGCAVLDFVSKLSSDL